MIKVSYNKLEKNKKFFFIENMVYLVPLVSFKNIGDVSDEGGNVWEWFETYFQHLLKKGKSFRIAQIGEPKYGKYFVIFGKAFLYFLFDASVMKEKI